MKITPCVFLLLCFSILMAYSDADESLPLSEEGLRKKAQHDFLFETFSEGRETLFLGEGSDRGLKEITILDQSRQIRHGDEVTLPAGSERVAFFFRHFGFRGADLDRIREVHVIPFSPDKSPPRSAQVEDFYRVQMPTIPNTGEPVAGPMKIRFLMKDETATCRIDDLRFFAQNPISPTFDRIPFVDLGSDQPRLTVAVDVDTEHELVIGGSADLQRERWFRMHIAPGSVDQTFEQWAHQRGFLPARAFLKFKPALTDRNPPAESLQEDPENPGSADLSFFERYNSSYGLSRTIQPFRENTYLMCFNDWPDFMSVPLKGRGTPEVEHFDAAAELAAAFVADQIKDAGYTATWWEVKNESSVKSEWDHHFAPGKDGWGLLADFHNRVASAIHKKSPGVKVGGPASAYMQMQVKDFTLYRSQARFIEETRGQIDFFSHHFYENAGTAGAYARRGDGYSSYLLGRYEAILDMLRAHMEKVDHVLPILVTETGSLQNGREPSENWHRLYAWSAYLNKSMQRPDQLDLFIPFIFLHMPWNPHSGDAAFTPREDVDRPIKLDDFEPSIIASFFELWRDFDGKRLPVSFDQDWLDVTAVHDGRRVSLAVTNMGGQQLALDLSETAKAIGATQARQVRLNYHGGEVSFEPETKVDPAAVPVDVNETTVIRLLLPEDAPLKPDGQLTLRRHYATETAVKSVAEPIQFLISVDSPSKVEEAHLLIGLHRQGGIHEPLEVRVNDTQVEFAIGDAAEFSEYFGTLEAKVPAALLKAENDVTISVQKDATITSVQILTTNSLSPSEN